MHTQAHALNTSVGYVLISDKTLYTASCGLPILLLEISLYTLTQSIKVLHA